MQGATAFLTSHTLKQPIPLLVVTRAYDALGRRISETQPGANLTSCPAGPPTAAAPFTASIRYDAGNRVTGTISPSPNDGSNPFSANNPFLAVRTSYDAAGRPTRVETGTLPAWQSESVAPASWANFTIYRTAETSYDAMGRKTRDLVREGAAGTIRTLTQYSYDAAGRPECTAVRMNQADFAAPPASVCTQGTGGADRITRTIYDLADQRLQLREGVDTGIEAAEATWAYNLAGQVTTVIDGNGNRAALRYDGHGRQDRWTFPSTTRPSSYNDATPATALASAGAVNAADYEDYTYDPNGNRTSLRKRDNTTLAYSYDALNRVTVKTVPERPSPHPYPLTAAQTRDVYYSYDLRNLQLSARFTSQAGEGITNVYDGFGRLASSTTNMGGVTRTLGHGYDANGNRLTLTHPDGTWFGAMYDGLGRQNYLHANNSLAMGGMFFLPHGGVSALGRTGIASSIGYDGVLRPATLSIGAYTPAATDVAFAYTRNPASQIASIARNNDSYAWTSHYAVTRPYTTNGLNQYSAAGGASFTYDANGNLTSDGTNTFTYDVENRLVGRSGGVTISYDPLGRLLEVASTTTGTTRFLYDGDALVAEYNGATLLRRHVDPSGECEVKDGKRIGVCSARLEEDPPEYEPQARAAVDRLLADDTSDIRIVDREAVARGRMVGVRLGTRSVGEPRRSGEREDVNGELVEVGQGRNAPIIVTIDPTDPGLVYARNEGSDRTFIYPESIDERIEHAVVGHARHILRGRGGPSDQASNDAEDNMRRERNSSVRRVGFGGPPQ